VEPNTLGCLVRGAGGGVVVVGAGVVVVEMVVVVVGLVVEGVVVTATVVVLIAGEEGGEMEDGEGCLTELPELCPLLGKEETCWKAGELTGELTAVLAGAKEEICLKPLGEKLLLLLLLLLLKFD